MYIIFYLLINSAIYKHQITQGVDLDMLVDAGVYISSALGRTPSSRVSTALVAKATKAQKQHRQ